MTENSAVFFFVSTVLTLSLTGVGPSGPALTYMQIPLKVQKVRYRQKLGIPQAGSWACFKIKTVPI
jgi:hypothetical protein